MATSMHRPVDLGSFILDERGRILGFDEPMERLTGRSARELIGRPATQRTAAEGLEPLIAELGELLDAVEGTCALTLHDAEGRRIAVDVRTRRLDGPARRHQIDVLRVLDRGPKASTATALDADPLTGLGGLASFEQRLAQEFQTARQAGRPLAIVLVDIDRLRDTNQRFGTDIGDMALRRLAGLIRTCIEDDRAWRIGDDDFAILLPGSGRGEARQTAARIRSAAIQQGILRGLPGSDAAITLSIGAASSPADADTPGALLARATDALDEARGMGRNRVWCYLRRPRVPLEVPVYFDGDAESLVGYSRDLSPSGIFVQTALPIDVGMRCGFAFPVPGHESPVRVIGRVVRTVPVDTTAGDAPRIPGMGVEFEHFESGGDRRAIDAYLHLHEGQSERPEDGTYLSV